MERIAENVWKGFCIVVIVSVAPILLPFWIVGKSLGKYFDRLMED